MGTDAEENKGVSVCYNVMSYTDDLLKLRSDQIGAKVHFSIPKTKEWVFRSKIFFLPASWPIFSGPLLLHSVADQNIQ